MLAAAQKATSIRGAGFIENRNQRLILRSQGRSLTPEQIAATVLVHQGGANVTLGQVGDVHEAAPPAFGAAAVGDRTGVMLVILAQYGTNTTDVTGSVEQALKDLRPALERGGITLKADLFRPANLSRRRPYRGVYWSQLKNLTSSR